MKILIVSQYYYPERFLINEIAPELVKRGNEVTVLTGKPNYPEGIVNKNYRFGKKKYEIIDGVEVIRTFETGRRKGKIPLIINYISFALSGSIKARFIKKKYDIVFSYQLSPVTSAYPAIVYKKKHKVPHLLYCLDIWPESAVASVGNQKSLFYKIVSKISKDVYEHCDQIAVTSEPFIEYLNRVNNVPLNKMLYIPQHSNGELLTLDLCKPSDDVKHFMYAGNLGHGQTVEVILQAAALIKDRKDFRIHLVGSGSMLRELQDFVVKENMQDKIVFHGQHSMDEMKNFYKLADALIITLRGNNFVGNTMPGKLQTYMTTGKPILGAINGAAKQVIDDAKCGACVASGDYIGLADLMSDFLDNSEKYADCGKNAREYFKKNFTKEIFMNRLEKDLEKAVNGKI